MATGSDILINKASLTRPPFDNRLGLCNKDNSMSLDLIKHMMSLTMDIKANFIKMVSSWSEYQKKGMNAINKKFVVIQKLDLQKLQAELRRTKQTLRKLLSPELFKTLQNEEIKKELETTKELLSAVTLECQHWNKSLAEIEPLYQQEKKNNLDLHSELEDANEQICQLSEYCTNLGTTVFTLLWRVSCSESNIQTLLEGAEVDDLFNLMIYTLESYIHIFAEGLSQDAVNEPQFIQAVCGIITNIAATGFGRDILMENNRGVVMIDTFFNFLATVPRGRCVKVKNLILMAFYNMSINPKGLKYLSNKKGLIGLLVWVLQEEKTNESQLNVLRLILSLICVPGNITIVQQLKEFVSISFLQQLTRNVNSDIQEASQDLLQELSLQ